ncbi:MAG TPA: hypothetical protein DG753_06125 [Clostridium sp.]|nr:hypothetical protein [Clostridium sp.]
MAKHRHKEQESSVNNKNKDNMNSMNNNNPFGIDPVQLMNLLGGNFDMTNMTNMLASMNTNGFNLGNLGPLAQMAGLNLDNNMMYGNGFPNPNDTMNNNGMNHGNNINSGNINNKNVMPSMNNINLGNNKENSSDTANSIKKSEQEKGIKEAKVSSNSANANTKVKITQNNDLEFLVSLKGIVNQEKIPLINKMIELYKSGAFKDK